MGFNFSHPQKSGGAMAPLAPPSERALLLQSSNCYYNYILLQVYMWGEIGISQLSILFYFQYLFRLNKDGLSRGRLSTYLNVRYMCQNIGSVFHPIEFSIFKYLVTQLCRVQIRFINCGEFHSPLKIGTTSNFLFHHKCMVGISHALVLFKFL